MTEFTPTSPTPTAVPWTPDMAVPPAPTTAPSPAPIPPPQPVAHPAHQPMPSVVQQPQYQAQAQHPMPQTPQMNPPVQPQTQAHLPLRQQMAQQIHPQQAVQSPQQIPAQYGAAPQPHYGQQHLPPHMQQPQMAAQPAPGQLPRQGMGHAMPPPAVPHLQQQAQMTGDGAHLASAATDRPKSLLGKLLKRSPKPIQAPQVMDINPALSAAVPAASGSLFNKNFVLGAVAGLLVGAFLPVIIGMVSGGGNEPIQAQVQSPTQVQATALEQPLTQSETQATSEFDPNAPAPEKGDTFLDSAINSANP